MDYAFTHLIANAIPVLGSLIGIFVLGIGVYKSSNTITNAAYIIFIFSAFGTGITYYTGKWAEETIKNISVVSMPIVEQHKTIAEGALAAMIILAISTGFALWYSIKKYPLPRNFNFVILAVAFVSFAICAATAILGFSIRHPELMGQ